MMKRLLILLTVILGMLGIAARKADATISNARIGVILVHFQNEKNYRGEVEPLNTPEEMRKIIWTGSNSANALYKAASFSKFELAPEGEVIEVTIPDNGGYGYGCPLFKWQEDAAEKAKEAGFNFEKYTNIIYEWPVSECNAEGFAFEPGHAVFLNGWEWPGSGDTVAHELGHNFNLGHAHDVACGNEETGGIFWTPAEKECDFGEYGNFQDTMACCTESQNFNAIEKDALGWWGEGQVKTITQSGSYFVRPDENNTLGIHLLAIKRLGTPKVDQEYIYIEFHVPWSPFSNFEEKLEHEVNIYKGVEILLGQQLGEDHEGNTLLYADPKPEGVEPHLFDNGGWHYFATALKAGESYEIEPGIKFTTESVSQEGAVVKIVLATSSSLSAPTGLKANVKSKSEIDLTWNTSKNATSYEVFRNGSVLKSVTVRTYKDLGLTPNTTYSYQVRAVDGNGNASALSSAVRATTKR